MALFVCLLPKMVESQDYTPFSFDSMQWIMREIYPQIGPNDEYLYYRISTLNDTLVNGVTYTNLTYEKECFVGSGFNNEVFYVSDFPEGVKLIGGIREADKRVYFYSYESYLGLPSGQEHLLYDFNASIGDTVFFTGGYYTIIVSQYANGNFEIAASDAYLFPLATGWWNQGVGSSYGLFGAYEAYFVELVCMSKTDELPCTPCNNTVAAEEAAWKDWVQVFPNPVSEELVIKNGSNKLVEKVQIFDLIGKLVLEVTYSGPPEDIILNVSNLDPGILVLKIYLEGDILWQEKIVKM